MKLAIIAKGFVGRAVDYGFQNPRVKKYIVDPMGGMHITSLPKDIDVSFVCVPTPMSDTGEINSSIMEEVVDYLVTSTDGWIVIKSTVIPEIIERLAAKSYRVVYNPEFLMEKSANQDFVNPFMHVFGGEPRATKAVQEIYEHYSSCKPCPVYHMTAVDAAFVKYGINCFLASKVLWFNQFYDIVNRHQGNYGKIIRAIGTDQRVSPSHTSVPGFDGKKGFGGACFIKDSFAFLKFAEDFSVLREVIRQNQEYRKAYELDDREKAQNVRFDLKV